MAGRIPQHFIDELLGQIDIVDIIDSVIPLKAAGRNLQACCPFHKEKTPSFTVSPEKQFYHCFGCGAHGTAITFLMEYSGMTFPEAIEDLASRIGLNIPNEIIDQQQGRSHELSDLYELMELVVRYYREQLKMHPKADIAIDYLKSRGLSGKTAALFEIGYAAEGWDNLLKILGGSEAARERLTKIGMCVKKDNGRYYDRFRNRIMFPIRDHRSRIIGFGGRVMGKDTPKYLNSPETPIFRKGQELYGLHLAKKNKTDLRHIYIVEGYMDVVAMAQFGIVNTVATLGTAATKEQLEKLFRYTSQLIFCFDGDPAGQVAAERAMKTSLSLLKQGRSIYFMFMPEGEDPDSYIHKKGKQSFEDPKLRTPLSDYLITLTTHDLDLTQREDQSVFLDKMLTYLKKMPQSTLKELLLQESAKHGNIEIGTLRSMCQDSSVKRANRQKVDYRKQTELTTVAKAIRILLNKPELAHEIDSLERLLKIDEPGAIFMCELISFIQNREHTTSALLLEHWRSTKYESRLNALAASEEVLEDKKIMKIQLEQLLSKIIKDDEKRARKKELSELSSPGDAKHLAKGWKKQ